MSIRILHLFVIVALIVAAAYVYDIKFEATMQAERLSKVRGEIRREREGIAALRAEWAKLSSPARIEELTRRHLALKPLDAFQIDTLANLPERKKPPEPQELLDPIAALITGSDALETGSVGKRSAP